MSTSAEIAEVYYSAIDERGIDFSASIREPLSDAARREKKRVWMYSTRTRQRVYRCGRCGALGHNRRVCTDATRHAMRGTREEHVACVQEFFSDLRIVAQRGKLRLNGPDFSITEQPANPQIDKPGTYVIAVRLSDDDGRHLVGLLELSEFAARVVYATKQQRGRLDAAVARLQERFA